MPSQKKYDWSNVPDKVFEDYSLTEISHDYDVSKVAAMRERDRRCIAGPDGRVKIDWTTIPDKIFAINTNREIAEIYGVNETTVSDERAKRDAKSIPKNKAMAQRLMGTMSDKDLSAKCGYHKQQIMRWRHAAGVPAYVPMPMVPTLIQLPKEIREKYVDKAKATGRSISDVCAEVLIKGAKKL